MPRACTICMHPQRTAIEQALGNAIPLRTIADQWSVSKTALIRHKQAHLSMRLTPAPTIVPQNVTKSDASASWLPEMSDTHTLRRTPLFGEIQHVKQRAFLVGFVRTGSRVQAAKLAGCHRDMHWYWLKHDEAYRGLFAAAERLAADHAEEEAWRRGVAGYDTGVWYKGERVGTEKKYSDGLLLAILRANCPEKYRDRINNTHDVSPALAALMAQWQALREQPIPARQALPEASYDADATDAAVVPLQDVCTPGRTRRADVFKMLDALNQHDLGGDTDGDG